MTETPTDGRRPAWLSALLVAGWVLLAGIGLPLTVMGLVGIGDATGRAFLFLGLLLLLSAAGGVAREVVERRARRQPPSPRLVDLAPGERALFLPRAGGPTRVASLVLLGYGLLGLLSAVATALDGRWAWAVGFTLGGAVMVLLAAPGRDLAGGMWFSPSRLVHEHDGLRWEAPWDDVTGVVPQQPMPVLVRPDRPVDVRRVGPPGRAWRPTRGDGVLAVDARFLAGGPVVASYVIGKAITDPASRSVLGTPESLPPPA